MRRAGRWALALLVAAPLLLLIVGQAGGLAGNAPGDLGVGEGKLKQPSMTDNSVSSQAAMHPGHPQAKAAAIAPLALVGGDGPATLERLRQRVGQMPGAEVVTAQPDYLYVRFRSRWLGFVDDAEFWFDPSERVIQVRSASRLGRRDFGVNRARIEALREALARAE